VLAFLLVLWALLEWSVRGFVTKLKIGHEVLTAASSFFTNDFFEKCISSIEFGKISKKQR
jgi:hypothetical protein